MFCIECTILYFCTCFMAAKFQSFFIATQLSLFITIYCMILQVLTSIHNYHNRESDQQRNCKILREQSFIRLLETCFSHTVYWYPPPLLMNRKENRQFQRGVTLVSVFHLSYFFIGWFLVMHEFNPSSLRINLPLCEFQCIS